MAEGTDAGPPHQPVTLGVSLKLYLDATFGPLCLEGLDPLVAHFGTWPKDRPILAHAEGRTVGLF